jgi:hypothetical protein
MLTHPAAVTAVSVVLISWMNRFECGHFHINCAFSGCTSIARRYDSIACSGRQFQNRFRFQFGKITERVGVQSQKRFSIARIDIAQ